ncbi:MAG: PKD domain-containing protein [Myxococcota bacterium]
MRLLSVALLTAGLLFVLASVASPPASAQCTPNPSLEFRLIALAPSGGQGEFYFVTLDQQPALADSGEVAFSATASIDFVQRQGVFRGAGGAPTAIATGDAFPPQLGSPDIDAEGRVAYRRGGSYIVVDGAGTAKTVIQVGDMFGGYRFDGAGDPRMNSSGTLALRAYLGISPADTQGNPAVMRVPLAGPAGAAVAAFTGNGGLFASIIGDAPVLDDLGQLAYLAVPIATGQATIFAGSGGPVASTAGFAALGQPAVSDDGAIVYVALPLTGGRELRTDSGALGFSCNASSGFDVPAINDAGTVAVMGVPNSNDVPGACQSNPPETGPDGIYLFAPPYGAPTRIVALGDCLFGRTVVALNFSSKGLDALDEVVFWVSLSDGSTAIVRAGPPRPNTPPVLAPIGARSVAEGSRLAFTASASDADGDPLTFSMTGGPAGASMTAAGAFTWTPTELQGPGDYSATIVVDDGANRGSDSETIALHVSEVNVPPEVDFALAEYVISVGGSAHLTDLTSDVDRPANALARTVDWGDGGAPEALVTAEASHLYPAHGAYLIALEVDDGQASVTRTHTLTVNAPPVAGFTLDPGTTVPRTHVLTLWSEASDPDGDIAYESVDWGDGSQIEYFIGSIEHAYSAHGDYTVTQTVVDRVDASDVARRVVHVVSDELGPPTAAFAVSGTPLTNETVRVLDQSLGALPDDALDDLVDWGDGTTSAVVPGDVATHVYDTPDLYTIVLTATDPRGRSATDHVALTVASHRPVAELGGPAVALIGQVVAFQDASHDVDGTADLSSVIFDWGDGSTSSVAPAGVAEHAWSAAGDFSVTLSASDRWGERDSATQVIHVSSAPPTSDITLRGYRVEGEPLTLEDRSHDGQGLSAVDVTWGDGAESSIAPHGSAVHVYEATGVYTVRLTATNTRGERATSSTDLTIVNRPPPVAQLALSGSFFFGETLRLVDQSQPGLPGDVLSALVDWGDGSTSPVGEDTSATHVYAAPGAYTVALTVTDQTGRRSIDYFAVTIRSHPPIAEMSTHALALVGEQVTLADLSSDADGQGDIAARPRLGRRPRRGRGPRGGQPALPMRAPATSRGDRDGDRPLGRARRRVADHPRLELAAIAELALNGDALSTAPSRRRT